MTQLLIAGVNILAAGPISEDAEAVHVLGQIFPKGVLGEYKIIDEVLPPGRLACECEYVDGALRLKAVPAAPDAVTALARRIDADVDALYAIVIGNRSEEYNSAREQAKAYAAAGYAGAPPAAVQSWMDAKQWPARKAADDILAAAARLSALRDFIRAQRLACKEAARMATTAADLDSASAQWCASLNAMHAMAGLS